MPKTHKKGPDQWKSSIGKEPEKPKPPEPKLGEYTAVGDQTENHSGYQEQAQAGSRGTGKYVSGSQTPAMQFPPGTWVRISSGRMRSPWGTTASGGRSDDVYNWWRKAGRKGGAPARWKQYHLYRKVPANGTVWVTLALTGIGTVQFDNIRVEPLNPGERPEE